MFLRRNFNFIALILSSLTLTLSIATSPILSHQVEISGNVGATIHIEPNDNPRANKSTLAWFALTKKGGKIIPLEKCKCRLEVYQKPYRQGNSAIAKPELKPVSAEGYKNIPGANITFPRVGSYELVLKGSPVKTGDFKPFVLNFSVTVAR